MYIKFSWMGLIGYGAIAYALFFAEENEIVGFLVGGAFFVLIYALIFKSLNPFAPWTKNSSSSSSSDNSSTSYSSPPIPKEEHHQEQYSTVNQPSKRFCSGCGAELSDDAIYCDSCGKKVG